MPYRELVVTAPWSLSRHHLAIVPGLGGGRSVDALVPCGLSSVAPLEEGFVNGSANGLGKTAIGGADS